MSLGDITRWYVEKALDDMVTIVEGLGDDLVNERPDLPGANTPYAIVFHTCGVVRWWGRHVLAGEAVVRDRPAEFRASGSVADLLALVAETRAAFAQDCAGAAPDDPPRGHVDDFDRATPLGATQAGVLLHVVEEAYQHLGQLELTRDVLRRQS